jgi:hypothetical protein
MTIQDEYAAKRVVVGPAHVYAFTGGIMVYGYVRVSTDRQVEEGEKPRSPTAGIAGICDDARLHDRQNLCRVRCLGIKAAHRAAARGQVAPYPSGRAT